MQQPRRSLAAARERRAESQRFYRFEDQANDILRSHARHLDAHRRSVMLFYLVFGLIAGFMIGMIGARSAHAATSIADPAPAIMVTGGLLLEHGTADRHAGKLAIIDGLKESPFALLELADSGPSPEPERYAALIWPDHAILFALGNESTSAAVSPAVPAKPLFMSMSISILAMAGLLSLILATHAGHASRPRWRMPIGSSLPA